MPSPTTGTRLNPLRIITSTASSTRNSPPTVTMSGRGTITSRTTVSPNSMICSMRSRSSSSITSSSTATSARASSSSSDTKGPSLRPLPGSSTLAIPIRPRERILMGQKRASTATGPAASRAERSGCWMAQVLGAASATVKTSTTLMITAIDHAPGPEEVVGQDAQHRGPHQLADEQGQQHRIEEPLGSSHQPQQALAAMAVALRQGVGLAARHAGERRLGQGQEGGGHQEQQDRHQHGDVAAGHLGGEERMASGPGRHGWLPSHGSRRRGPWWRASTSRSRACMAFRSSSSA